MRTKLLIWVLLSLLGESPMVFAQVLATPTSTPSLMCCQMASPWNPPPLSVSSGVVVDTTRSRVYVTDRGLVPGDGLVRALNYDGSSAISFGTSGSVSVAGAFGLAVGKGAYDGVYVVQRDNGTGVTKLDPNGNEVWSRSPAITGSWRAICVDDWGNVYAATDTAQIIVWDSNGNQQSPIFPATLNNCSGLYASGSNLYVSDTNNSRIVRLVQSGVNTYSYSLAQAVTLNGGADPYGITQDPMGNFYIAVKIWKGFAVFDGNFNQLTQACSDPSMVGAFGIALDDTGAIYIGANVSNKATKIQGCYPRGWPVYGGADPPSSGECFIFPSPAKGDQASLSYSMAGSGRVELKVWNEKAEWVADITDRKPAGVQVTPFSISRLATGIYFYQVILTYDSGRVEILKPKKFAVIH